VGSYPHLGTPATLACATVRRRGIGNVDFINWRWFTSLITHARMGCGGRTVSRRQPKV